MDEDDEDLEEDTDPPEAGDNAINQSMEEGADDIRDAMGEAFSDGDSGIVGIFFAWLWKAVVGLGDTVIGFIADTIGSIGVDGSDVDAQITVWHEAIRRINYVLPVSEGVGLLVIYLGGVAVMFIYKLVKSWIPTLSS